VSDPRYVIAESSGYPINPAGQQAGNSRIVTEVMVLDRAYCHRVVWSSLHTPVKRTYRWFGPNGKGGPKRWRKRHEWRTAFRWPLEQRREYARELAARLNAEDEAAC